MQRNQYDGRVQNITRYLDFFLRSAHRCFIISEMRLRAAVLMCRRGRELLLALLLLVLPAGLPRRRPPGPSRADIARSRRSRSRFRSLSIF